MLGGRCRAPAYCSGSVVTAVFNGNRRTRAGIGMRRSSTLPDSQTIVLRSTQAFGFGPCKKPIEALYSQLAIDVHLMQPDCLKGLADQSGDLFILQAL